MTKSLESLVEQLQTAALATALACNKLKHNKDMQELQAALTVVFATTAILEHQGNIKLDLQQTQATAKEILASK
jgi:hypothetical protein